MFDTDTRTALGMVGITDQNIDALDLFAAVPRPETEDVFYDDTVCEPVTLTAGQVAVIRGALRGNLQRMFDGIEAQVHGFWSYDGDWDQDVANLLSIENTLAEAWAACKSQDFTVPDTLDAEPQALGYVDQDYDQD